jgi:pyruvate kinase
MSSRAQIVATIGPSSMDESTLSKMLAAGMDVARINFSHGTHESNGNAINAIRAAAQAAGKRVPIIADLPGPRMKTEGGHAFDSSGTPAITDADREHLDFCVAQKVDYIAQSYIGSVADVRAMREEIKARGASIPLIAKIERKEAVDAFDAICAEADAIMIARGDLGLAIPIETMPFVERDLLARAKKAGKPVITATQMLLSMTEHDMPTRAEVTDVAYAILSDSDAVMLSEETALGKYPVEAVAMMERVVSQAEKEMTGEMIHPLV